MQCNLINLFTLKIKRNKWLDILFPLKLNIRVWTGSKGVPSTTRGFSKCRAVQRGFKWLQHRQVREAKAKDGAGCGWYARIWHPRTPQKIQKSLWMKRHRKCLTVYFFYILFSPRNYWKQVPWGDVFASWEHTKFKLCLNQIFILFYVVVKLFKIWGHDSFVHIPQR